MIKESIIKGKNDLPGHAAKLNWIAMPELGESLLGALKRTPNGIFSLKTTAMLGVELVGFTFYKLLIYLCVYLYIDRKNKESP